MPRLSRCRGALMRKPSITAITVNLCVGLACLRGVPMAGQANTTTSITPAAATTPGTSAASESWQKDFDAVCSKTQDAMSFTQEELMALIQKCDTLLPQIEKLDE